MQMAVNCQDIKLDTGSHTKKNNEKYFVFFLCSNCNESDDAGFFFPFSFFELKLCCVECCCEKSPLFKLNAVLL